jgi:cell division protein FtsB
MNQRFLKAVSAAILAYALISLPVILFGEDHYPKIAQLEKQLEKIRADNDRIRWQIREVKKEIEDLRSNNQLIRRVAHQEFGFVSDDELIFIAD